MAQPARSRPSLARLAPLLAGALAAPSVAHAGGLTLPGFGPVSIGRAGAAVAAIDDPSALAVNPAGLAGLHGTHVHLGLALVDYHLTFDRDGTYDDVQGRTDPWEGQPFAPISDASTPPIGVGPYQIVPVVAVASDVGRSVKGLTVAAGVFAPTAYPTRSLGADYVLEDPATPPPPSRYDTVEQKAAVVLPSVAVAYRARPELDLGARFSAGFATIDATTYVWGLDNFDEWAGQDARFHVDAQDSFVPAFGLGAKYRPTADLELGLSWSSAIPIRAKGTGSSQPGSGNEVFGMPVTVIPVPDAEALCGPGGSPEALTACVDFDLPMQTQLGARWAFRDGLGREVADVELDVAWERWSAASDYDIQIDGIAAVAVGPPPIGLTLQPTVIRHNFQDTFGVRLGGSWQRDAGPGRLTLRGGAAYDTAAAKKNWERVDIDGAARSMVTVGASYALKKMRFDLGGGVVLEPARSQGTTCNPPNDTVGCDGGTAATGPDPIQPTKDPTAQTQSPFAAGSYESGYTVLMLGATTWF